MEIRTQLLIKIETTILITIIMLTTMLTITEIIIVIITIDFLKIKIEIIIHPLASLVYLETKILLLIIKILIIKIEILRTKQHLTKIIIDKIPKIFRARHQYRVPRIWEFKR
jgi:hypothetical protein